MISTMIISMIMLIVRIRLAMGERLGGRTDVVVDGDRERRNNEKLVNVVLIIMEL